LNQSEILEIVLEALTASNQGRLENMRLEVSPTAKLFGRSSPLDSLGLVALLIDIEDAFDRRGVTIVLSDERAMAQSRSPFRDVPALVEYIGGLVETRA
jgi:acyl carrier protein